MVVCLGSGGVGKTTTAAALAMAFAEAGERVVVMTVDPARRLADALGISNRLADNTLHQVLDPERPEQPGSPAGELWATMLDPAALFREVIKREAANEAQARRILDNRLFKNLTTNLSGTNEYMAAERLHELQADERFDRIVIDTPPSRHALDFLDAPARLTGFVDHRLYQSVLAPRGGFVRTLNLGARVVVRLLGRLVGSELVDDVLDFFAAFEGLDRGFRDRADQIDKLLTGPGTGYVLVATAQADRVDEAQWIVDNLARRGLTPTGLVLNRCLPLHGVAAGSTPSPRTLALADKAGTVVDGPLAVNLAQLQTRAFQEQATAARLVDRVRNVRTQDERVNNRVSLADRPNPTVVYLPEQDVPVGDLATLQGLAQRL